MSKLLFNFFLFLMKIGVDTVKIKGWLKAYFADIRYLGSVFNSFDKKLLAISDIRI
jgi:hypothetical protein